MKTVRTTHTGSLPRPAGLTTLLIEAEEEGVAPAGLDAAARAAVTEVVELQAEAGLDLLNDGEQGKPGYSTYVRDRLTGFSGEAAMRPPMNDLAEHPDFAELAARLRGRPSPPLPSCDGPIAVRDPTAVQRDLDALKAAARAAGVAEDRLFMSAASPGVISVFFENHFYKTREEYLAAIVAAMRPEYQAIVDAGVLLQLDCPDFAMSHNNVFQDLDKAAFRREVATGIEALNAATEGLSPERMRIHVCWGNYESPHTTDVALGDIIDLVDTVRPAGIALEAANPRHAHEWALFESYKLSEDHYVIPGVVDTTTNFVEHPELIAQRIGNYTKLLGVDRVVAGTDCGFESFIGRDRVVRSVCWAKLRALVAGARLVS